LFIEPLQGIYLYSIDPDFPMQVAASPLEGIRIIDTPGVTHFADNVSGAYPVAYLNIDF
jgi:hypothetical protein